MTQQAGFIRHQPGVSQIIYPNSPQPLNQQPCMSTFKPFANQSILKHNNNLQHRSFEDNLNNMVNGNQTSTIILGSNDKLHNYNAYQEPNDLVPTALSPNQDISNVQNMRFYQLNQQQLRQQQLFQQHSLIEKQKALEKERSAPVHAIHLEPVIQHQPVTSSRLSTDARNLSLDSKSDEQWIDGPRVHKSRVAVSRTNNKNEQDETWVDGPQVSTQSNSTQISAATSSGQVGAYGFMDDHKKTMIEKWVEVQTAQVVNHIGGSENDKIKKSDSERQLMSVANINSCEVAAKESVLITHLTQFRTCDESTNGSDVDTLSEDPSASGAAMNDQPSLIEELERKHFIPSGFGLLDNEELSLDHILISSADETKVVSDCSTKGRGSPETTSLGGELSIDEVCSQCEAMAEECEELSSLLSCEEEECKRQIHQGLGEVAQIIYSIMFIL